MSIDTAGVANQKYIYLTTRGRRTGNPHTVELWFAIAEGRIYLSHEGPYTDWMKNILVDDGVQKCGSVLGFKGKVAIHHPVQSHSESVDVDTIVHAFHIDLFGRHAERSPALQHCA